MKKQIVGFAGVAVLFFAGCGGGGGSSARYDDPKIIEDQTFFRVKSEDVSIYYIKEFFDENNNTLYEGTYYETNDSLVPDSNKTISYYTDLSYVHIEYDPPISCRVIDSNVSVEFWCLKDTASGILTLYTTRWKNLDDARENPEE
jgi:hypothetical protein